MHFGRRNFFKQHHTKSTSRLFVPFPCIFSIKKSDEVYARRVHLTHNLCVVLPLRRVAAMKKAHSFHTPWSELIRTHHVVPAPTKKRLTQNAIAISLIAGEMLRVV